MSIEEREGRRPRSVRLTTSIDTRLVALCEHLGVTPNSYLVGVIGKAIATDEMTFLYQNNSNQMVSGANDFMSSIQASLEAAMQDQNTPEKEKQLPLDEV